MSLNLVRAFKEHPESVGETYTEHLVAALGFASTMMQAAICCIVHAFIPCLFTDTGSRAVRKLSKRMDRGHSPPATITTEQQTLSQRY
jgi:hypothetical protein